MGPERRPDAGLSSLIPFEQCIAKTCNDRPGMKVDQHCRIVGSVAAELAGRLSATVAAALPDCSATIAALHDVGKVSPGFQKKIANEHVRRFAPELASQSAAGLESDHASISGAAHECYAQPISSW